MEEARHHAPLSCQLLQMNKIAPMYPFATAPAILRSSQRDDFYMQQIRARVDYLFKAVYGQVAFQKSVQKLKFFADFLYLAITTGIGNQTLGEEYSDIIPVDTSRRILKFPQRWISIMMMVFTPFLVKRFFKIMKKRNESRPEWVEICEQIILGPIFSIHLAIFYFTGAYYHVVKRLSGVRYVKSAILNLDARSQSEEGRGCCWL